MKAVRESIAWPFPRVGKAGNRIHTIARSGAIARRFPMRGGSSVNQTAQTCRRTRIERSNLAPECYAARPHQGMPERLEGIGCPLLLVQGSGVQGVACLCQERQQAGGGFDSFGVFLVAHSSPASTNE